MRSLILGSQVSRKEVALVMHGLPGNLVSQG